MPATARAVVSGSKENYEKIAEKAVLYSAETGYELKTKKQGSSMIIEAYGVAAHGARPDAGLNAVSIMMDFLGRISFASEELNDYIAFYNEHIGFDLHGERIGCGFEDGPSGPLIFNVGIANISEDIASVSVNIRYPVSYTEEDVLSGIETSIGESRIGVITRMLQKPIYRDADDELTRELMNAYVDETGDTESRHMTFAGGTYAKMFNNILAFGALFPGEEDTMHQADEKLSKDSLMKMARIYARAIYSLCCK